MNMKQVVGEYVTQYVKPEMVVGLGTGSTVYYTIMKLGMLVKDGMSIQVIPTSKQTEQLAIKQGLTLTDFNTHQTIDLSIDGADLIDSHLNLIKGGGGALFREKVVALASRKRLIIVDESKFTMDLTRFPLPVEIVPFGHQQTITQIKKLGCQTQLRVNETDNGNYIVDCQFDSINEVKVLASQLKSITGVVEHGLFIDLTDQAFLAGEIIEL